MAIVLFVATIVGVLFVVAAEKSEAEGEKIRSVRRTAGTVILAIAGMIGAFLSSNQQGRIETLATDTKALVTGGDSFVWLAASPLSGDPPLMSLFVLHGGEDVPSFDVDIEFQRTGQCDDFQRHTMRDAMATGQNDPRKAYFPGVAPSGLRMYPKLITPSCDDAYYLALIQTRNRTLIQQLTLNKQPAQKPSGRNIEWQAAVRVVDIDTGEVLKETREMGAGGPIDWPDYSEFTDNIVALRELLEPQEAEPEPPQN